MMEKDSETVREGERKKVKRRVGGSVKYEWESMRVREKQYL